MKKLRIIIITVMIACAFTGCKAKKVEVKEIPIEEPVEQVIEEPVVVDTHEGEEKSILTGEWFAAEKASRRPYAIMFNNIQYASPQSGTSEASILYEALVEGGITRLMGIFEDFKSERIGSIRSARHYFVSFADEYDAIYVHFGETKYATAKISNLGIDNLSGLTGVGNTVYYRDKAIKEPHNAFASYEGIMEGTKQKKYRTEYEDKQEANHFKFYEEDTDLMSAIEAKKITLDYSNYTNPYFEYNEKDKLYSRFQFDKPHIDQNTRKQLEFKNIIIQYVKEWNIDKKGYQTMDIENSSGIGYYITNGKAVDITWEKNESTKKMNYYDKDGNVLTINPGKTFISIFPNHRENGVVLTN